MYGLIAGLLLCAFLFSGEAFAHAQLLSSTPSASEIVDERPEELRLTFNEPVSPASIKWFAPDGGEHTVSSARSEKNDVVVPVPETLARGTHLVSYRVTSIDGHVVAGSFAFSLGEATTVPQAGASSDNSSARLAAIGRFVLTLALTLGAGGAAFFAFVVRGLAAPAWPRTLAATGAVLGGLAVPLNLGLQGLDLTGGTAADLLSSAPYIAGLGSPFALTAGLAFAASLLAIAALRSGANGFGLLAGLLAWLLAAASFAASGHAATAEPQALMRPAIAIHAAAFLYWLGALPGLLAVAKTRPEHIDRLLGRFSLLAIPAVALLFGTGIAISAVQVGAPEYLDTTDYGLILTLKIAAFLGLVGLAGINRLVLTPDIARGEGSGTRRLAMSIRVELVLALLILIAASSFRLTPPPRAIAAADSAGVSIHIHQDDGFGNVTALPGRRGQNRAILDLFAGDGEAVTAKQVTVQFSQVARGVEPIKVEATRGEEGLWIAEPLPLTVSGPWDVRVEILVDDFKEVRLAGVLEIRP
ncbi:copper resistance protein CopC [Rhizobiales bacterium]|uniref:copper resistance CopC/CopD family protein n=1 Tax=Hongsoonwoonella zoysiae TaxID=2821844 RepID=UPI0015605595|nr:copper resistance protein CopC [Hongsoonwoonella zoysiae]NRG16329.1 copper resistance protein CopC [Hongsoonwoonella zoysiae]